MEKKWFYYSLIVIGVLVVVFGLIFAVDMDVNFSPWTWREGSCKRLEIVINISVVLLVVKMGYVFILLLQMEPFV